MSYVGTVRNGVIVPSPEVHLTEGVKVSFTPLTEAAPAALTGVNPRVWDLLAEVEGSVAGPEDLARNHDRYANGAPNRTET